MKIGKYKKLVKLTQSEPQNKELAGKLRDGSVAALRRAQDTLFDPNASAEVKREVVDDLRDIRSAFTNIHDRIEAEVTEKSVSILKATPSSLSLGERDLDNGKRVGYASVSYQSSRRTQSGNSPCMGDTSSRHRPDKWLQTQGATPMTGIKNFIVGLSQSIGLASTVAALPPGPVAVSVSTLAKVEGGSEFSSESSASEHSGAHADALLGLAYYSEEASKRVSNSSSQGKSHFSASSVDERLNTSLEKLAFQAEQLESKPPVDITIGTTWQQETWQEREVPTWFGLSSRTEGSWTSEWAEDESDPMRLQSEHIWMPKSSESRFE